MVVVIYKGSNLVNVLLTVGTWEKMVVINVRKLVEEVS